MRAVGMIGPEDFVATPLTKVARQLGADVHLWRLPYARAMGRAPMLALLSAYLDESADALELRNDEHGKPHLFVRGGEHCDLQFNWSHSGTFALVALARSVTPGVDIEQPREGVKVIEIAQRFFAPDEVQDLVDCEEAERHALFLRLWCAKEAVLKALGRGLAFGLDRIAFEWEGKRWQPARFAAEAGDPADWQVQAFAPAPGWAGALAWDGAPRTVRPFR